MKSTVKSNVLRIVNRVVDLVSKNRLGRFFFQHFSEQVMQLREVKIHRGVPMTFVVPSRLTNYRVESFSTKEPDTLAWIDSIPQGSTVWDVGANIGLYSVYAAKARNCMVFSFEPSVFNLELLARNVCGNALQDRVNIIPIALSDTLGVKSLNMSSTSWGGALSTFGAGFDQDGCLLNVDFRYNIVGVRMDDAVQLLRIPVPQFLKIDVDGIEHFILRGGRDVLRHANSVLIEINEAFIEQQRESAESLTAAGLVMVKKFDLGAGTIFNQLWVRPSEGN